VKHYLIAMDEHGNTIDLLDTFEDWSLAIQECGLLNDALENGRVIRNKFGTIVAGYEIVSEEAKAS